MSEHTKTPWEISGIAEASPDKPYIIKGKRNDIGSNAPIAYVIKAYERPFEISKETKANAEFIVRACNNFDLFIRTLNEIISAKDLENARDFAKQTLSKVQND